MPQNLAVQIQSPAGQKTAFNVAATKVIKAPGPGTVFTIRVITAPSASALTLNDCALVADAALANELASIPFGLLTAGALIQVQAPFQTGLVVSSIGTGGVYTISYS